MRLLFQRWPGVMWVLFVLAALPVLAEDLDDQYVRILGIIQQGDLYSSNNQAEKALAKYRQAQLELQRFQKASPDWNPSVVTFRMNYLEKKIAALSAPKADDESTGSKSATPAASSGPKVKLLEAGAEPRQVLRMHPQAGDKQPFNMTLKLEMEVKAGDAPATPVKMPVITLNFETTVKSVSPEGDIAYDLLVNDVTVAEEAGVMPMMVDAMKASFGGLKGASAEGVMSNRGFNKRLEFKAPSGADAQTRQAMEQMKESFSNIATPLPEEPVGSGSRWEATTKIKSQGMTIDQTSTWQPTSIEGDRMVAKNTVVQTAANQKITNPTMPGVKLDLDKMNGSGTADVTIDLSKLLPVEGAVDFHSDSAMGMNVGGQKQTMSTKMSVHLDLSGK